MTHSLTQLRDEFSLKGLTYKISKKDLIFNHKMTIQNKSFFYSAVKTIGVNIIHKTAL